VKQIIDRATKYAEQVAEGRVIAGKPHIQACMRHLNDLSKQGKADFPYLWKPEKSQRIIEFAETLTIAEGAQPLPLRLYGCQDFDLGVPMGWIHKDTGNRRFRRKYKSVARQNGKSMENGVTGTYIAGFSGYNYGKLFTAANKKRQSRIAWEEMQKFVSIDPDLAELFKVQDWKSVITAVLTKCTIEALSKEAGLDDGFRAIFASVDELHQAKDGSVYNAIYRGTRALPETLVSAITTRGKILNGFCRELDDYCLKILSGNAAAEDFFADIYTLDKDDDPFSRDVWIKPNPVLMQRPGGYETQARDAQTAKDMGGEMLADYLTKCCNLWAFDPTTQYIDPDAWKACGTELTLADMKDRKCWAGIDLSGGGDLTSIVLIFPLDDGTLYVWSHSYMPLGRFQEHIIKDLAPYQVWRDEGSAGHRCSIPASHPDPGRPVGRRR
jgi:phage terminase large subunit-like protein